MPKALSLQPSPSIAPCEYPDKLSTNLDFRGECILRSCFEQFFSEGNRRRGMGTSLKQRKSPFCSWFTRKSFSHRLAHETPLSSAFRRESAKTLRQKHHYRNSGTAFGRKTLLSHPCESSSTGWGAKANPSSSSVTQASTTAASNRTSLPAASSASTTLRSWAGR
jgi:hypothetical protein